MSREVEMFAIDASTSDYGLLNRWVMYGGIKHYDVYLETTKESKVSKVHASAFDNQDEAIEFIIKMDKLCTNGKPFNISAYLQQSELIK